MNKGGIVGECAAVVLKYQREPEKKRVIGGEC
jgi:hypothetical protein